MKRLFISCTAVSFLLLFVFAVDTEAATVGYWRFEEGVAGTNPAGTADEIIDSSTYGNHGMALPHAQSEPGNMVDMVYSSDVSGSAILTPSQLDNDLSMSFDDWGWKGRAVRVEDDASLDLTTAITLEAIINWTGETQEAPGNSIVSKWNAGGSYAMRIDYGKLRMYLQDSSGATTWVQSSVSVVPDEWTHVACTWSTSDYEMRLFINGVEDANAHHFDGPIMQSSAYIEIGRMAESNPFTGLIDEVRISNTALSPSEFLTATGVPGDANCDGVVDATDASILAANWLQSGKGWIDGDFTGEGTVDEKDATLMASNWTGSSPDAVPEPSMLLLLMGLAAAVGAKAAMKNKI